MDRSLRLRFILLGGLFLAVITVGFALLSFYRGTARLTTVVVPPDISACDDDDDCGVTNQISCCPCEASGGQGAVNKQMRPRLKAFLNRACRTGVPCVDVVVCRDDLGARCENHECTLTPPVANEEDEHGGKRKRPRST